MATNWKQSICPPTGEWTDKMQLLCTQWNKIVVQRTQLLIDAVRDEPQKHANQKKLDMKGHTSYDSMFMKCPEEANLEAKNRLGVAYGWEWE